MSSHLNLAIITLASLVLTGRAADPPYLHAPAVEDYAKHDPNGVTILSNGRFLKPAGKHLAVAPSPYGLAMSRDGKILFVASDGVGQIVTEWREADPVVAVIDPPKYQGKSGKKEKPTNGGGADFSPDGHTLYWSSGETGAIYLLDTRFHQQISEVSLNTEIGGRKYEDSYVVDVKVSGDGKYLYCADVTNFRIVVIDAEERLVVG